MANSKRRLPDQGNKMFIPYNIGGGTGDDHFISGGKLGLLVAILVVNILIILNYVTGSRASIIIKLIIILVTLFVDMYLISPMMISRYSCQLIFYQNFMHIVMAIIIH